ncbi:GNAT domain-containing protein [Aspergillus sergii]|uniref:GNAT domain-containing protein n=1 Tax=Aspergillus sergii TaxID=1034303 RepID=A0A5N6X4Z7_9EURO|nr:GNAT domain-containing protein [Aspergillus sergii]
MCYAEPVIRYAAISLADLHRSFADSVNPNGQWSRNTQHSALVHYASALSHMKSLLCSKIQSMDTFLTACLLLSSIEIFQGRYQAADVHLRCAFHMSEIAKGTDRGAARQDCPNTSIISKYPMVGTLMRMRFQCDLFLDVASTTPGALIKPGQYFSIATPDMFTSLGEAQDILFNQIDRFFRLINQIALAKIATTPGVTSGDVGDRRKYPEAMAGSEVFLREMQTEGVSGLDQWDRAYQAFRSQYAHTFSTPEQHAATLVEIYRDALRMLLQMDHSQGALAHDPFERGFGLLLSRLQRLLDESPQPACTAETPPVFTLEIGIVPILYFIATNCRNYGTRHAALAILAAAPRREGTWDGSIIYTIAQRSVALEEKGRLDGDQSARGIPPSSRLIGMEAGIDPVKQSAFLVLHQLKQTRQDHVAGYHAIWSDPVATRWSAHGPCKTIDDSRQWMSSLFLEANPMGENYAVLLRQDMNFDAMRNRLNGIQEGAQDDKQYDILAHGGFIGWIGTWRTDPLPEVGFIFHRSTWGLGFATEALRAFVELYWSCKPQFDVLEAYCDTENEASVNVLRKYAGGVALIKRDPDVGLFGDCETPLTW